MRRFRPGSTRGFTLMEVIVVIALITVLAAISMPAYFSWIRDARYKEAARDVTSAVREARSRAVQENWEFAVEFDLANNAMRIMRGNRYAFSTDGTAVTEWNVADATVGLRGGMDTDGDDNLAEESCSLNTEGIIAFHTDGSRYGTTPGNDLDFLCIMNAGETEEKFRVNIVSNTTGKAVIVRP